jgi:hypothetical protein
LIPINLAVFSFDSTAFSAASLISNSKILPDAIPVNPIPSKASFSETKRHSSRK